MEKIGFIGLGNIGKGCALNILKAGFDLTVYDIRKERIQELMREGAKAASSPKEVAQVCDIVCLSLPHPAASEEVVLGENGLLAGAKKGSVIIEMSIISPAQVRRFGQAAKEKGVEVIDSCVTGGREGALAGTLHLMVGGKKDAVERCRPVLEAMSEKIYYCGDLGSGEAMKLCYNAVDYPILIGGIEVVALAVKEGVDLKMLYEIVRDGPILTESWKRYTKKMILGQQIGVAVDVMLKTVKIISEMAREHGVPLWMNNAVLAAFSYMKTEGVGSKDYLEFKDYLEKLLDIKIEADIT